MRALLVLLLLGACDCGEEGPPAAASSRTQPPQRSDEVPVVLAWDVTHPRWGREWILLRRDGRARYLLEPPGLRGELDLGEALTRTVRDDLLRAGVCELESGREGQEDESRPSLTLAFVGLHCEVALWYHEWATTEAHGVIEDLRGRLRYAALHPPGGPKGSATADDGTETGASAERQPEVPSR